jgi:hypothetical protein
LIGTRCDADRSFSTDEACTDFTEIVDTSVASPGEAFAPDGRFLAATVTDAEIRIWVLAELLENRTQP